MDHWRDWIPEADKAVLEQYEAQGLEFRWADPSADKQVLNRRSLRVYLNGALIVQSDPTTLVDPKQEMPGVVKQTLIRTRTYLRQHPIK